MTERKTDGVSLPPGLSGSRFFHGVLTDTALAFPHVFGDAALPAPDAFKQRFPDALVRFEAARVASPERAEIARFMTRRTHAQLVFRRAGEHRPLAEHLAAPHPAATLVARPLGGPPGLVPEVPFEGRVYRGAEVADLATAMRARHLLTDSAAEGVRWLVAHAEAQGGALDLTGQRFAILGAGAELAPTASLLRAGATVLWIDPADPDEALARLAGPGGAPFAGTLVLAPGARDLLTETAEIAAALRAFAADGPIHLGLFAYAPGASRELRLAAAMDAIARSLDPALLASVALYISPTTPATVQPEDRAVAHLRKSGQPLWKKTLSKVRALPTPGHHTTGAHAIAHAIIPLQGPGYQAAQYLTKMATAESWASHGADLDAPHARPVTISANVAGISNTRSLQHPLFQAAFTAAPTFLVKIFEPATTRALSALLMLRDLLDPAAPGAAHAPAASPSDKAARALSQHIHGGVYALPWRFDAVVRTAAMVGLAKRPSVLWRKRSR